MKDKKTISLCKEATQYILDNNRIYDTECKNMFGEYYGYLVFNELKDLHVGDSLGYGPIKRNKDTRSFLAYFDGILEEISQKEADKELDRENKKNQHNIHPKSL